jgi:AraC family transcriptional regulator of adaptative response / DNA-3-methyladenine glycosylase II
MQFAKKLIDETKLPMSQIALASGFGCVRRFNADIRKSYHRTPTQIRRIAKHAAPQPDNDYRFRLRFRPPYNWPEMLAFLAARATPGVEVVDFDCYRRSISWNRLHGYFEAAFDGASNSLSVRVQFADPCALFFIVERIRAMFDLNADWTSIIRSLRGDPNLGEQLKRIPGLRVPGCWDGFELAVRAILGQQITVKGATSLAGRLVKALGQPFSGAAGLTHLFPTPETLAEADLSSVGLTKARAETLRSLARAVCDGKIRFSGNLGSDNLLKRLKEIPGIGEWTAQYVAMRALGESDAFPASDLALLRTMNMNSPRELARVSQAWRPWRAYAAMYLWSIFRQKRTIDPVFARNTKLNAPGNDVRPAFMD